MGSVRRHACMSTALIAETRDVLERGAPVSPRGLATKEVLGKHIVLVNAVKHGLPIKIGRKVAMRLAAIEGAQLLAGIGFPDVALEVAPALAQFADTDPATGKPFFQGSYSDRLGDQLRECERQLRDDPDCRQAVASLWSESDRDRRWRDRPCTTELQWLLRPAADGIGKRVVAFTYMRSNDAWKGFSYDVFQFGQLQAALAHVLGAEVGETHHIAASFHLYEDDFERAAALQWEDPKFLPTLDQLVSGPPWHELPANTYSSIGEVNARFQSLLGAKRTQILHERGERRNEAKYDAGNAVEQWYADKLEVR